MNKELDWPRIAHLLKIGIAAALMVLAGDMLLGWGVHDPAKGGLEGFLSAYPPAEDITLTASGMTVHNPGTVPARPKLTLYGSGTITLITYSNAVVLSGIGNGIILDWEAQECMSLDGGTLLNDKVDGDPQHLPPGDSTITWTGTVSRLVVTPNWQFL